MNDSAPLTKVRIWDLPVRVFHWLLALAVVALVITGKVGEAALTWHMRIGLLVGALLAFRLVWGVVGGRWSRFTAFVYHPKSVWRYLKGDHRPDDHFEVGHNPLGSFSVFALLGLLMVQVVTGTLADDEVATVGPLNRLVSAATGLAATGWHKGWGQQLLIVLVALHVAAVAWYRFKGKNLVRPMVTGDKDLPPGVPAATDSPLTRLLALVVVVVCVLGSVWVARLGS